MMITKQSPIVNEVFADNGEHSHWELINPNNGKILWTEQIKECTCPESYKKVGKVAPDCQHCNFKEIEEVKEDWKGKFYEYWEDGGWDDKELISEWFEENLITPLQASNKQLQDQLRSEKLKHIETDRELMRQDEEIEQYMEREVLYQNRIKLLEEHLKEKEILIENFTKGTKINTDSILNLTLQNSKLIEALEKLKNDKDI